MLLLYLLSLHLLLYHTFSHTDTEQKPSLQVEHMPILTHSSTCTLIRSPPYFIFFCCSMHSIPFLTAYYRCTLLFPSIHIIYVFMLSLVSPCMQTSVLPLAFWLFNTSCNKQGQLKCAMNGADYTTMIITLIHRWKSHFYWYDWHHAISGMIANSLKFVPVFIAKEIIPILVCRKFTPMFLLCMHLLPVKIRLD